VAKEDEDAVTGEEWPIRRSWEQIRIALRTAEASNMETGKNKCCFRNRMAVVLALTHYSCKLFENGHTSIHVNPLKFGSVSAMRV
jgi:hypothetical protein